VPLGVVAGGGRVCPALLRLPQPPDTDVGGSTR